MVMSHTDWGNRQPPTCDVTLCDTATQQGMHACMHVLLVDHEFEDIVQLADIYKVGNIPETRVTIPAVKEELITNAARAYQWFGNKSLCPRG